MPSAPPTTQPAASTASRPAGAGAARRHAGPCGSLLLGRFDEPTYITSPRGDSRRFVVERAGRIRVLKGRRALADAVPRHLRTCVTTGGESGLLSMAFARDYATLAALLRLLHGLRRASSRSTSSARSAEQPGPRGPELAAARSSGCRTTASTTRAASSRSGPTGCCTRASGTAAAGGDPDENAQNLGRHARQADPDRRRARTAATRCPSRQPVPRPRPARGRRSTPTACGIPGGFPSTARPATSTLGDVGQEDVEEIDFVPRPLAAARHAPRGGLQLRLGRLRGPQPLRERQRRRAHVPPVLTAHAQTPASARSPAAT